jgi:hypothetical protein
MAETEKKEPGQSTVIERRRGDPRQHHQPIDKHRPSSETTGDPQDQPPESSPRGPESPWMGGG